MISQMEMKDGFVMSDAVSESSHLIHRLVDFFSAVGVREGFVQYRAPEFVFIVFGQERNPETKRKSCNYIQWIDGCLFVFKSFLRSFESFEMIFESFKMIGVEKIHIGFVDNKPFCTIFFGELCVDSASQGYFKSLKRPIEGCAHGGVPSIKAHGFLAVSARFPKVFSESIRREKRLQPLQVFHGPRKRLAFFFHVVHTLLVSLGAASALQASEA